MQRATSPGQSLMQGYSSEFGLNLRTSSPFFNMFGAVDSRRISRPQSEPDVHGSAFSPLGLGSFGSMISGISSRSSVVFFSPLYVGRRRTSSASNSDLILNYQAGGLFSVNRPTDLSLPPGIPPAAETYLETSHRADFLDTINVGGALSWGPSASTSFLGRGTQMPSVGSYFSVVQNTPQVAQAAETVVETRNRRALHIPCITQAPEVAVAAFV